MEPSKALIEAGARGIYDAEPNYEDDPVAPWENVGESTRKRYIEQATACLRAAMVGVKTVYVADCDDSGSARMHADGRDVDFSMREGDTLAVFRGGE